MKTAEVRFTGGEVIVTSVAEIPEEEILSYYAPGKLFNLGSGDKDSIQRVISCQILPEDKE